MFFQKNLPMWERALRLCLGLGIVAAVFYIPLAGMPLWLAAGGGIMLACTGFIGFCPMCAMAGRTTLRKNG